MEFDICVRNLRFERGRLSAKLKKFSAANREGRRISQ